MQKTILIVEDDDNLRNFLKKVLAANNFKVAEAADGAQALEAVEKYLPDLVLLDFGLPKVPGETVCVKIKKDHPEIIVIALTEKTSSLDVVRGLQIGADDYISKPFVAEELVARIDARFKAVVNGQSIPEEKSALNVLPEADASLQAGLAKEKIIFRESIVLIIIRLICTEAIFGLSLFLLSILSSYLSSYLDATYLSSLYLIVLAGGFLVNIGIVISIALKWNSEYTEVSKEGVMKHSGILNRKEQTYACNFVEGAKLDQSLLGLLFNYGTIELYDPALKEQVYLSNIANPKRYSKTIQSIVSKENNKPMPFVAQGNNQE
ncbi:MAG: response regulator transcription factor [Candidatus Daviesbacteria bacterium]|nr:response regulator transcription factor [Candidatus Daviesbacteria bacterium]